MKLIYHTMAFLLFILSIPLYPVIYLIVGIFSVIVEIYRSFVYDRPIDLESGSSSEIYADHLLDRIFITRRLARWCGEKAKS